jgi:Na+-transporting NADH:ubiquinone oxidoreductase subunit B
MGPILAIWLWGETWASAYRLVFFLLAAGIWHLIFMLARVQPPSFAGALTAIALAMLTPENLGAVQMVLGVSFGVVMAELAFGGWGRNVLNPAVVALAFLGFGFPAAPWPEIAVAVGWAAIPAALIGMLAGVLSARLVAGALLALGLTRLAGVEFAEAVPALLVVLILLVADPVASASTSLGRWLNGALFGALAGLFLAQWDGAAPVQLAVAAALLASLAAPLLDEIALALWTARKRRRLG